AGAPLRSRQAAGRTRTGRRTAARAVAVGFARAGPWRPWRLALPVDTRRRPRANRSAAGRTASRPQSRGGTARTGTGSGPLPACAAGRRGDRLLSAAAQGAGGRAADDRRLCLLFPADGGAGGGFRCAVADRLGRL